MLACKSDRLPVELVSSLRTDAPPDQLNIVIIPYTVLPDPVCLCLAVLSRNTHCALQKHTWIYTSKEQRARVLISNVSDVCLWNQIFVWGLLFDTPTWFGLVSNWYPYTLVWPWILMWVNDRPKWSQWSNITTECNNADDVKQTCKALYDLFNQVALQYPHWVGVSLFSTWLW